jgi:hypothetical protein
MKCHAFVRGNKGLLAFAVPNDFNYAHVVEDVRKSEDVVRIHGSKAKPTVLIRIDLKEDDAHSVFPPKAA